MVRKWQVGAIVTIMIFIAGLLGGGWLQRPIVDYVMFGLPDSYDSGLGLMEVSLRFRNRGNIDAILNAVVTVTDANITVDRLEPWIEYSETQVKFQVTLVGRTEEFSSYEVKIFPVGEPQNFTIAYSIEDTSNGWSINGIISHLFLEPHPFFPTSALYNRTGTTTYEWLKYS